MRRVAVIGAGTMGHSIALDFALGGYKVDLVDVSEAILENARAQIRRALLTLAAAGMVREKNIDETVQRLTLTLSLHQAVAGSDYVVEAISENLTLKESLFRDLGGLAPAHAVLLANTSGLSVSALCGASRQPQRTIVTHYWNPPHLIPLVEVVPAPETSEVTLQIVHQVLTNLRKRIVVLRRDIPGFIGNRLQFAMLREAFSLVEKGIASPEDVDTVVKYSIGRRLGALGPFEIAEFGGLDVFHSILSYLAPTLDCSTQPPRLLAEAVQRGDLGVKSGRGLRTWSDESVEALRSARDRLLLSWLAQDRNNGGGDKDQG